MFSYFLALICVKVLTAEEILLPDGRHFYLPNQEKYSYILKNESPSSVERLYILSKQRNDVALICPKGYAILEMTQELVIPPNLRNLIKGSEIRHSASLHSKRRGKQKLPPCRALYECLGYQACFFTFSHHLCFVNEALLSKSYLLLSIVCFRDDLAVIPPKFKKQKDQILHFFLDIHGLGYSDTSKLSRLTLSERDLFSGKCSVPDLAKETEGFYGTCLEQPIPDDSISENLFYLFARTHSKNCRMKLQQVYCALQYSKEGFCIPPIYINHKKSMSSNRIFGFQSLPKTGPRPRIDGYKKFLSERNEHLIPSRLAFVVLVYNDSQAAMDLIHSIYKEQFLYVIHIDEKQTIIRQNLIKMIEESRFPAHNVYILPLERSFITYPISYETVRAQLEGYEEVLRLGVWDFAISLTENDVLLRSVDDLSMALAPYRGLSFVSSLRRKTGGNTSRLIENAYFPCDGFVYNVSMKYFDFYDKFQMFYSSSGIYSRQFIQYLVNENSRSSMINKFQFYLQTYAAPVESYISTVLMNSPFKQYTRIASIHDHFDLHENTNFSNSDYPLKEKEPNPISKLLSMSHKSFFVRRNVKVRNDVMKYAQILTVKEYYGFMEKYFPPIIVKALSDRALEEISVKSMIPKAKFVFSSVLDIHVTPSLVPHYSSCNTEAFHEFNSNFNYWFDISVFNKVKYATEVIRLMLQPTIRTTHCFDDGVFKMLSILPWKSYEDHNSATDWLWFGMNNPLTFPYGPSFIKSISLNLYFSKEIENMENVLNDKRKENPFVFKRGSTIKVKSKLIAPDLSVCSTVSTITWSSLNSCPGNSNHTYNIKTETPNMCLVTIDVPCKKLGPGLWTLQIEKIEPSKSKLHSVSLYLLDLNNLDVLNEQLINFSLFWTLKGFAFITKNYTFNFQEQQGYTDEDLSLFEHNHVNALTLSGEESQPLNKYYQIVPTYRTTTQIFLCSGGFASTIILLLSVFWIYTWRYSFLPNILLFSILSLFLGMAVQIVLFLTIC